jgi:hypothetical protein
VIFSIVAWLLQATASEPPLANPVIRPDWLRRPGAADMARGFPAEAARQDLSGSGTLQCVVTAEGTLSECQVIRETPPDHGFASATMALSTLFKMRTIDAEGRPTAGRPVRIPIRWVLPVSASAGPIKLQSDVLQGVADIDCRYRDSRLDNCLPFGPVSAELASAVAAYAETMSIPRTTPRSGRIRLHFEVGPK